jgi:ubiquitin C-terminal hydrolase
LESKKNFIVYEKHKIYGFSNILNNCYLNSSLQLLTRIDEFKKYILNFKEIQTENNETKGNLILEFKKMLNLIESSNNKNLIIDPSKLKRVMGCVDERYFEDHQEDSNEFISNFIDALLWETGNTKKIEEKIKILNLADEDEKNAYISFYKKFYKRRGYSFILDLFYGVSKTNKLCKACNKIFTIKFNSFNMIELPIFDLANTTNNNYLTFDEIINNYLRYNKIKSICKYCKNKEEIYSKISLYTLPKYLIISFGRSINNKYVYTDIKYNDTLRIKSDFDNFEYNYKLECVIQHSGGANSGHYTALCPKDTSNKIWYRYSDEDCNQDDSNTNFQSKIAIILLYKCI